MTIDFPMGLGPSWYPIALVVIALPLLGETLHRRRQAN
jgi:hypothetical protein